MSDNFDSFSDSWLDELFCKEIANIPYEQGGNVNLDSRSIQIYLPPSFCASQGVSSLVTNALEKLNWWKLEFDDRDQKSYCVSVFTEKGPLKRVSAVGATLSRAAIIALLRTKRNPNE